MLTKTNTGFSIQGDVSFNNVVLLRDAGEKIISAVSPDQSIVVDLSAVADHDAAIFTLILCWMRFCRKRHQSFSITHAPQSVLSMRTVFGMNSWINC